MLSFMNNPSQADASIIIYYLNSNENKRKRRSKSEAPFQAQLVQQSLGNPIRKKTPIP